MPLSKAKGNMYDWCDFTHTHLRGECSHKCSYCYVQALERRFGGGHYVGELRLKESEFTVKYGKDRTIFIEHCNDLFAKDVPMEWQRDILAHCCNYPENTYVFQTKNPRAYFDHLEYMPPIRILGCTIETDDCDIADKISEAPDPISRRDAMCDLTCEGERQFITIEPILNGDMRRLAQWCCVIAPEFVNIGADSKGTGLPEPSADQVQDLIHRLQAYKVEIRAKHNLDRILNKQDLGEA